jgi:hypothetical protein
MIFTVRPIPNSAVRRYPSFDTLFDGRFVLLKKLFETFLEPISTVFQK